MSAPKEQLFKGAVHATTAGLAMTMCLYNLLRCCQKDKESKHTVNAVVYGVLWGFESYQTWTHWRHTGDTHAE